MKKKVNMTLVLDSDQEIYAFENWIRYYVEVTDFVILTDTRDLYNEDAHFRDLSKKYYALKKIRNDYINKNK